MFTNLTLTRPMAVVDLETTGVNPQADRIIEVSILKVFPDAEVLTHQDPAGLETMRPLDRN